MSEEKLQQVKSMLRSVLLSVKEGVIATRLQRDYEDIVGEVIPFRQLGFGSFEQFIRSIPDVVRIDRRGGDVICHGVHDDSTAHIKKLVSKQRSKKIKKPARRPRGGGSARFMSRAPRRPPVQPPPYTPRHHVSRHGIPTFISPPSVPIGPMTPVTISIGNTQSNTGRVIRVGSNSLLSRAMSEANNQDRNSRRPPPPTASTFEVPPRFRKMQGGGADGGRGGGGGGGGGRGGSTQQQTNTSMRRPRDKTEVATIEGGEKYCEALLQYMRENNQRLQYETTKTGIGFVSYVKVNNDTYGSEDIYKTEREAEAAAARRAMQAIDTTTSECRLPPIDWNETESYHPVTNWADEVSYVETGKSKLSPEQLHKVRSRVKEILENKLNGLWNTRIPHMYEEKYKEEPPTDLLDLIKSWTDIARVEPNASTNREIVYPVQDDPCMNLEIPKTLLVNSGEPVTVYMTFIDHPGYFFVQREDSSIEDITEMLQKHCKSTIAPPSKLLKKGRYCAGIFSGDGQWTRAEILQNKEDGTVELLFVDYGNVENVRIENTRWLSPELSKHPYQAINCCLYGIQYLEGDTEWSPASTKMFADMVQDEALIAIPENLCDGVVEVQMYVKSNQNQTISDRLSSARVVQSVAGIDDGSLDPVDLQLPEDKEWDVHVTYISSSLTSVMLRLVGEDYSEKLDAYQAKLEEAFRNTSPEAPIVQGVTYIAYDDDLFHRVRMISKKDDKVECYFLDHGDTDELLPEQLHPIDPQINKLLPYQAVEVSLYGLEDVATNMTALEQMCELALGKSCVAEIAEMREEIPSIILYDTSGEKDININDTILDQISRENSKTTSASNSNVDVKSVDNISQVVKQNGLTNGDNVDTLNDKLQKSSLTDIVSDRLQSFTGSRTENIQNSDNQSVNQSTNQSVNQSTNQTVNQSTKQSVNQSAGIAQHSSSVMTDIPSNTRISSEINADSAASRAILGRSKSMPDMIIQPFKIPAVGEYFDLHVNFVRDPSNFVCIPYGQMNDLEKLLIGMLDIYGSNSSTEQVINKDDVKVGQYYAGQQEMVWFRVKIHSFVGADLISVYQVDIGEYCVMTLNKLRPLVKQFCELPAMAFNATLGKVSPKSGSWFEAAKYKFIELAQEKDLIGLVLGYDKTSGAVQLRLIDTSNENYDVCIDEVLVKMGFANFV